MVPKNGSPAAKAFRRVCFRGAESATLPRQCKRPIKFYDFSSLSQTNAASSDLKNTVEAPGFQPGETSL
jgi:hypothetical protein